MISLSTRLFVSECKILQVCDFKLDLEASLPFIEYTKRFARLIYEPILQQGYQNIIKYADAIANDSFVTYVNLIYPV